jgi:hypothetical protein
MRIISKWDNIINNIFSKKNTFLSSTELIELLCNEHKIQRDYARQIIKRAVTKKIIKSSDPLTFNKGQYVYMGLDDYLDLSTLIKITKKYKPPMYRVLSLLNKEDKIISFFEARKAAAVPVENLGKYKLIKIDEEIKELIKQNILFTIKDPDREIVYLVAKEYENTIVLDGLMKRHFEKMRLDSLFLPDIVLWLKEHNFVSHNQIVYRRIDNPSIGAKHNDFLWDAFTYTNTTGFSINTGKDDKQTLVVLDVLIHREYCKEDLDGFYNRIQSVRHSTHGKARKILPIIFFVNVDSDVKREMKRLKLLNFSLQNIFGTKITTLITQLDNINSTLNRLISTTEKDTENVSVEVIANVENSLKSMDETGHLDNLQNLKGDLFESLMYVIVLNLFPFAKKIRHSKTLNPYEYDIIVEQDLEVIIIELKGFKSKTVINLGDNKTKNTVKWFFGKTFPHTKTVLATNNNPFGYNKGQIKACYITSANFSNVAKEFLQDQNATKLKPDEFDCFYDQKSLLNLIKTHKHLESIRISTNFVSLLERYYLTND